MEALFGMYFAYFINDIVMKKINDDQLQPEINTMINAVLCLTFVVKHYMGHRMQSMVQLNIIEKFNNKWTKWGKSRILVVLDHKHKDLGMNFSEGQV